MKKQYQLPREFGEKWVEALRSGEYGQTKDALINDKGQYCCLGVACKVVDIPERLIWEKSLTTICANWAYDRGIPESLTPELHKILTDLNDYESKNFNEIADYITENVEFI